jgi:hypothetical protein
LALRHTRVVGDKPDGDDSDQEHDNPDHAKNPIVTHSLNSLNLNSMVSMRLDCGKLMEKGWREKGDLVMRPGRKSGIYYIENDQPITSHHILYRDMGPSIYPHSAFGQLLPAYAARTCPGA